MNRQNKTYEELVEEDRMCLTERLHIRFTTWDALKRAIEKVKKDHGDKNIHGEIIVNA